MKKQNESTFRKALLLSATTLAALAVTLGLPVKKALAGQWGWRAKPASTADHARAGMEIIQPKFVNPSTVRLIRIADQALSDEALAERIFRDPDAVAEQYGLSNNERLVLRHMDQKQFRTARNDAARVVATRLSERGVVHMPPGATNTQLITERMIVGRAILAAVGRSYLNAANADGCCPWSKAIELGINSDPAYYNVVFQRPSASEELPAVQAPWSGAEAPQSHTAVPLPVMKGPQPGADRPR